jgi:dTDP-glucose pyrophosphorylase/predicted transcriptional regulator
MIKSVTMQRLDSVIISPTISIADAIARLDKAGTGALVICSTGRKLYGILTDGDIRRAVMKGTSLSDSCSTIANRTPVVSLAPIFPADAFHVMDQHDINHLPVVNEAGELLDFLLRKDFGAEDDLDDSARRKLDSVVISPTASITDAIARLDKAGTGALVLCTAGRKLFGLLTDGDIRRAILHGIPMETACETIASRNPVTAQCSISPTQALHLMNQHDINHLPLVDDEENLLEFRLRKDLIIEEKLSLSAVIMAGGFGKRLLPLTEQVPKPMLPVGDRPLLELTIEQLRRSGIRDVSLTTHYLPENIVNHFGNGEAFGVNLSYVKEDHPLGTAGGLKLMKEADGTFLVINGDILTGVSFQEMLNYHHKYGAKITVGVRKYEVQVPFGVVECEDVRITQLKEKPTMTFFVNAGMYLLEPSACDYIPEGQRFDMTDLIQKLLEAGRPVVSFPIVEYWLDVGRLEDYKQAQEDIRNGRI